MEMKQKEQEINKRKKRLLWKEKRMKETVLNAMNPVEREIFEKELQKVHLKKSTALNDIGKTVWDTKKIRELLDQDAELEEIKRFFDENQLKPNQYNRNAIPLAAYTYWYGRGCSREDVCLWALESATTIDGLLQVQESSHLEKIAKKFISMDKYGVVAFRKMYLHEELCWTDAPNYLAAVMSGNVSLLQMFEAKDEEMTEENMEYWEYTCEWDRIPGARKTYYSIRRETIVGDFYIPGILTAAILSGSPEMLDYCIDHYDIDGASLAYGEKEALGQAVAGEGKELTEYMLEHYTGSGDESRKCAAAALSVRDTFRASELVCNSVFQSERHTDTIHVSTGISKRRRYRCGNVPCFSGMGESCIFHGLYYRPDARGTGKAGRKRN